MKTLLFTTLVSLSLSFGAGCKKSAPSCEAIFEHTVSLVPAELKSQLQGTKDQAIAKCEKLSPESRQCAADAKSMEDLMKCPQK